jgi:hypothetical protein
MSTLFPDTHPNAEQVLLQLLRQAAPRRKLEMLGQMNEAARVVALRGLQQRHPEASSQELNRRLADLLLGPTLAERVYGPLVIQK